MNCYRCGNLGELNVILALNDPLKQMCSALSYCCSYSSTFSLFVSDLTPDVDDGMLYEFFNFHFSSCCSGKIVLDSSGYSKWDLMNKFLSNVFLFIPVHFLLLVPVVCRCCGFVSFESEREQRQALAELQGASGLGKKPLRLSLAANKLWVFCYDRKLCDEVAFCFSFFVHLDTNFAFD